MDYKEGLEELKKRYNNNEVSALIGSGFSKNIFEKYPSWDELLFDMTIELYQVEIEYSFHNNIHQQSSKEIDYQTYKRNKIKEIIAREGYLDIVSKYVKKKGFREALEIYIEKRIPYINEEKSTLSFKDQSNEIKLKVKNFDAHVKLLEGAWENIYTTNYDKLLEFTAKKFHKKWRTIIKAQDLSFCKQEKSIIKLHGDLCSSCKLDDSFEFDGNHHHRYIMTKEDYENYPVEHEAFTQLMRISLLQGTFCLFGFSGNDPNFIAWIRWVRDILVVNRNKRDINNIKIFLVDINDKKPELEKELFYNNHNIFYIPLLNNEVCKIINAEKHNDIKHLIISFLSYIYDNTNYESKQYNIAPKKEYQELWSILFSNIYKINTQINANNKNTEIIKHITELKQSNRIISFTLYQKQLLSSIYDKKCFNEEEIKILLLALKDTYYLPEYYPELLEKLENSNLSQEDKTTINSLKERNITLTNKIPRINSNTEDYLIYEQALRYAYNLDFTNLKEEIDKWNPQDSSYIPKKAILLYLFKDEEAKNILLEYIDTEYDIKERYYATQLLNIICRCYPSKYSTVKYENQNIDGLYELKEAFIKQVIQKKESLKPYGYNGKSYNIGNPNINYENSLRVLQFMIEFPVMLSFFNYHFIIDEKEWYQVFKHIFQEYPYPTLFYSLQCNTSEVLKRIGQEYAYSDDLFEEETPNLLDIMLNAYINEDTPTFIKNNILEISKEFFISVNSSKWENKFIEIWQKAIFPQYEKIEPHHSIYRFSCEALKYINSKNHTAMIIMDCLQKAKIKEDITISFLYSLRVSKTKVLLDKNLQYSIDKFISNINGDKEFVIAGNIYPILTTENKKVINTKIKEIIKGKHISEIAFKTASFFAKEDKKNIQIIKQALIENIRLWGNGLNEDSASPVNFIKLSSMKNNIKWNKDEIHIIYTKLKESFNKVISSHWYKDDYDQKHIPLNYNLLFEEMFKFLTDHQDILSMENDISEFSLITHKELQKLRGFININEALISDDSNKIELGLEQLHNDIIINNIEKHDSSINIILDRILLKKKEGLRACINYIEYYLLKYYTKENITPIIIEKLLLILQTYTKDTIQELDLEVPRNVRYFISISTSLKKLGYKSTAINYWSKIKRSNRFNLDYKQQ